MRVNEIGNHLLDTPQPTCSKIIYEAIPKKSTQRDQPMANNIKDRRVAVGLKTRNICNLEN